MSARTKDGYRQRKLDRFYTVADVATYFDVSPRTVRRWLKNGLRGHKFGGVLRIAEADILGFAERHRRD
jgi:excisionase family DNA binding protein